MVGATPETSVPHIIFSCQRSEPRKEALAAIKKSEVMRDFTPGIELGQWDCPPELDNLQFLGSDHKSSKSETATRGSHCHIILVDYKPESPNILAMQIQVRRNSYGPDNVQSATIGAVVEIAEKQFYMAPAHIFREDDGLPDHPSPHLDTGSECEFGGFDSDNEDPGNVQDEVDFMSQYSITPETSDIESDSDFEYQESLYEADSGFEDDGNTGKLEGRFQNSVLVGSRKASTRSSNRITFADSGP